MVNPRGTTSRAELALLVDCKPRVVLFDDARDVAAAAIIDHVHGCCSHGAMMQLARRDVEHRTGFEANIAFCVG